MPAKKPTASRVATEDKPARRVGLAFPSIETTKAAAGDVAPAVRDPEPVALPGEIGARIAPPRSRARRRPT